MMFDHETFIKIAILVLSTVSVTVSVIRFILYEVKSLVGDFKREFPAKKRAKKAREL